MTGFGKASVETPYRKVTIEIRTLNSKQLDLNLRLPSDLREKEAEIRGLLSQYLQRGKVDLMIQQEGLLSETSVTINRSLAEQLYNEMVDLARSVDQKDYSGFLPTILRMPDVLMPAKHETDNEEWAMIKKGILEAIDKVDAFRTHEGEILEKDFNQRIHLIIDLLNQIEPFEKERVPMVKERIRKRLEEWTGENELDQNRLEQEMIYYIEKFDITEEKIRLEKHCRYFLDTMNSPESTGKKLNFIAQEIGREINTIGSKANHAAIQKIVVLMKDELEKIKEQLFNIL
jgi:uncharacterized protein (TIGR00255 family)